ncbi:MAG: type III-A CRISPR-associated RAMP protein Csm4 [Chloroflexi bacterium]|nr:type III-A CRISPR-associated RAMP protein Csm4 [Chloroflexota bacterium]
MSFYLAKLHFKGRVRLGEPGIGVENCQEVARSDTLFSGLCHAWATLFGDLDDLVQRFSQGSEPPFLLSSAFVYHGPCYFLPKPAIRPPGFEEEKTRVQYGKTVKETSYLPLPLFSRWIAGEAIAYEALQGGEYPSYSGSFSRFVTPRVALDRATSNSQIYHFGQVRFGEDCGLYFIVQVNDEDLQGKLERAIAFLGELGLGGEKSSGYGAFELEGERLQHVDAEWSFLQREQGSRYINLSLFHPREEEIPRITEESSYQLVERGGWIQSPVVFRQLKRKAVTMLTEGSALPERFQGHLVDVTPAAWDGPHPIYRYGCPLMVAAL